VLVSVTPLGAVDGDVGAAAAQVVRYLEGKVTAARTAAAHGGTVGVEGYYADSLEGPGHWRGSGTSALGLADGEAVEPAAFSALLAGRHPRSGVPLARARTVPVATRPGRGGRDEVVSLDGAAAELGLSARYLKSLAARTQRSVGEALASLWGDHTADVQASRPLFATKDGPRGHWRVSRAELERFAGHRGRRRRAVIGYDVTFSAPKSVSLLWATATARQRAHISAAVDTATRAGLDYLESVTRARSGPDERTIGGVTAAVFRHATSRNLDPQLHAHAVVANLGETSDGTTRALDGRGLFAHAKTAGYLAAAELRHLLRARLGVSWGEVVHGLADVAGVPEAAQAAMSTRKHEIDSLAGELGVRSAASRQVAAWRTRSAKADAVDPRQLRRDWDARLAALGFDGPARAACYDRQPAPALVTDTDRRRLSAHLASAAGVSAHAATFDRRDVLQHVATWAEDRLGAAEIQDLADEFLASEHVVALDARPEGRGADVIRRRDGRTVSSVTGEPVYSTPAILAAEQRILDAFAAGLDGAHGRVDDAQAAAAVAARPGLGADQVTMVHAVCTSGDQVQCVLGPAGSGKTFALAAARAAWEAAGDRVLGAAEQGAAAEVLARGAAVRAETLEYWLTIFDTNPGARDDLLGPRTVMIVDEASAIGTRSLARLLGHTRATGTVVRLVGDPSQHSAVAAGGAFAALLESYPDRAARLREPRRQASPEMREVRLAVAEYRGGRLAEAFARLAADQRVVEADTADALLDKLVCDWWADRQARATDPSRAASRMVAEHHRDRRELNRRARALRAAHGELTGPGLVVAGQEFRVGDEVMCRTPARDLHPPGEPRRHVRNGAHGRVVAVRQPTKRNAGGLVVDFEGRGPISVPHEFLARKLRPGVIGGLTHAYALTTHAAQGDTYEAGRTLTTDTSTRAGVYVGLTRGRSDARLYTVRRRDLLPRDDVDHMPALADERATLEAVVHQLSARRHERLATTLDAHAATAAELQRRYRLADLLALDPAAASLDDALVGRAVHAHAETLARRARLHPDPALLARLGPRPAPGPERDTWHAALGATAITQATSELPERLRARAAHLGLPSDADATRLVRTAETHTLAHHPTAALAAERRAIERDLTTAGPAATRTRRHYDDQLAAASRRAAAEAAHANARTTLDEVTTARPRPGLDQDREHAQRRAAAATRDLAAAQAERDRIAAHHALFTDTDPQPARQRLDLVDRALALQVARSVQLAQHDDPPAYAIALLGTRPTERAAARDWDRRLETLERYRHYIRGYPHGHNPAPDGPPLQQALGSPPADPVGRVIWTHVATDLTPTPPGPALER
jgi:conjugative relaxase-like TrwC/TraI family protein